MTRLLARLADFCGSSAFPLTALSLLLSATLLAVTLLLMPAGAGALGSFAEDFRAWCFGATPGGGVEWGFVAAAILPPAMLASFILLMWWQPLAQAARLAPRRLVLAGVSSIALAILCGFTVSLMDRGRTTGELPFPAEAIRTSIPAPRFTLTDHDGQTVSLESLRGRVVMLTGIYVRCSATCPMIFAQAQRAVGGLTDDERRDLSVVAVTLDPEHDDVARLKELADGRSMASPTWRLATGDAKAVNDLLDAMGVERRRDPATGVIDHANMFVVVDREGRIAYRLTLGERQERWLESALRLLLAEHPATS